MPGMTLRFDDEFHTRLRLLALVRRKSAQQIIVELLEAEFDRVLTGQPAGAGLERVKQALGPRVPDITAEDRRRADALLADAEAEAARIYGDRNDSTAA